MTQKKVMTQESGKTAVITETERKETKNSLGSQKNQPSRTEPRELGHTVTLNSETDPTKPWYFTHA